MNTILNDTYEIKSVIGKGGMSIVYLAEHKRLKTRWAVKEVNKQQGTKFDFLAESNILKKLQHSMLPRIVDIFEDEQYIYIVEDYVEGVTLENWLKQNKRVDEEQGLLWFKELCGVLKYLHSQTPNPIIYRDMKPSNIMLQYDGTLKLIDFGIAREYKKDSQGDTTYIGTKGYAAPEQFGKAQTDARTDIYSLGVTMYHLVTGKSPYEPPYQFVPIRELNRALSPGLEHILHKCLQLEPEERYQNVEALLHDLQHIYRYDDAWKKYTYLKKRRKAIVVLMFMASVGLMVSGLAIHSQEITAEKAALADAYEQKLDSLNDYYTSGRMTEAKEIIMQARQLQPERIESYTQEAYLLYLLGDYQTCVTQIENILENNPDNRNAMLILAAAYFELGDYEKAAQCFQDGSDDNQEMNVDNLRDYAVCLGRLGQIEQAEAILEKLIGLGATADVTDYVRGEVAYAQADYSAAEERFRKVLNQTQTTTLYRRSVISLAETYRNSQQYTASIQLLENAITQEGLQGNSVLYEMLGAAYYNRGVIEKNNDYQDLQRAAECFQQVITLGVQKEYLYINVFTAYQTIGQYEQAEAILEQMEQTYPQKYTPNVLKATLYIIKENQKIQAQRDYTKAYNEYQKALEKVTSSDETTYLQQLEGLIEQLRAGGWL